MDTTNATTDSVMNRTDLDWTTLRETEAEELFQVNFYAESLTIISRWPPFFGILIHSTVIRYLI
jgi:hypothetical protein